MRSVFKVRHKHTLYCQLYRSLHVIAVCSQVRDLLLRAPHLRASLSRRELQEHLAKMNEV